MLICLLMMILGFILMHIIIKLARILLLYWNYQEALRALQNLQLWFFSVLA